MLTDAVSIHPRKPLDGLSLTNVTGACAKGIALANVQNAEIRNVQIAGYTGPLIGVNNVTGKGIEDAATIDAPKIP